MSIRQRCAAAGCRYNLRLLPPARSAGVPAQGHPVKRFARLAVGLAISALALWLLFRQVDLSQMQAALAQANYLWLLPSALVLVVSVFARARRWQVLLEDKLGLMPLFWITSIGYLLSNVLPFRLGELGRIYLATRDGSVPGMQALSTAVLDRLLDVLVVVALMAATLPFLPEQGLIVQGASVMAVIAFVGIFGLFIAAFLREWVLRIARAILSRVLPRYADALIGYIDTFLLAIDTARRGRVFWSALFWTLMIWLLSMLSMWLSLFAFFDNPPLSMGILAGGTLVLGLGLPSSPSGVGVYEAAVVAALLAFGALQSTATAYAVIHHLMNFAVIALLGVIGLEAEKVGLGEVARAAQNVMHGLNATNEPDTA